MTCYKQTNKTTPGKVLLGIRGKKTTPGVQLYLSSSLSAVAFLQVFLQAVFITCAASTRTRISGANNLIN